MCFSQTLSTKTGGLDSAHRLWFTDPWSNVINTWEQLKKKKKVGVLFPITFKRALFFITKIGRRVGFFFGFFFKFGNFQKAKEKKEKREKKQK